MLARIGFFVTAFSATLAAQPASTPTPLPAPAPAPSASPSGADAASAPGAPGAGAGPSAAVSRPSGLFERVSFGARVGANFASVATNPDDSSAFMKAGVVAGGFATVSLARYFEAELGVGYSQRGFNLEPAASTQSEVAVALNYLEAPALARARIPWGKTPATIRLTAGLNVLWLQSAQSSDNDETIDLEDQVNSVDVALVVGAGLDFSFGRWIAFFDVRHDRGMLDTVAEDGGLEIFNRVTSLQIGAAF